MISAALIELIEVHANQLAGDVARDLQSNPRTPAFRAVPQDELADRAFQIFHHLGNWIGEPGSAPVRAEFADWGAKRFGQGIPLSQIVYAIVVIKTHLRRYIREHGIVEASFPRVEAEYILPMHLHSLQELNEQVSTFFDEALFHLAHGYERAASGGAANVTH
jgi:hypothetical protein